MIELKKITKTHDKRINILDNVSLTIENGEYLEVIGRSGSGKSTFLNLIGLLESNYSGELIYDGKSTKHLNDMQISHIRNELIGFIFQSYNLIPSLTVYENIILPFIYSNKKMTIDLRTHLKSLTEELMINDLLNKQIQFLSGGEKQRVAICRALCLSPSIILADEPTGNLDPLNSEIVFDVLKRLSKKGTTIVLVTHNQSIDVEADRILTLHGGKFT